VYTGRQKNCGGGGGGGGTGGDFGHSDRMVLKHLLTC